MLNWVSHWQEVFTRRYTFMLASSIWSHPPVSPRLGAGEVHVWRVNLREHRLRLPTLTDFLSADEHVAAARFHFAPDRERYILARGLLREILGGYLAVAPENIQFSYGLQGKPTLAAPVDGGWLCFNLSHAHDLTLYAFCRDHEVGIDIEHIRSDIEYEQIARHAFSTYEVATLLALPLHERAAAFFRCWTIKEAYIKGLGGGLSIPLDQFDCAFTLDMPAAIVATRPDATQASRWTVARLDPAPDYTAALALDGPIAELHCWQVDSESYS